MEAPRRSQGPIYSTRGVRGARGLGEFRPGACALKWDGFNRVERSFDNVRYQSCLGRGNRPRIA
jgi:hypothetical protein